jgi:cell wall-associated NlpC family hydrolase
MSQKLRTQLCDIVKIWESLNVPYEHRGTTRRGCDCTGLIIGALRELGYLRDYKLRNYPRDWNLHAKADNHIVEEVEKVADKVSTSDIGNLVLFHFGKCVAHIGVVIENGLFIHCFLTAGKCTTSSLWNSLWTKRMVKDENGKPIFYELNETKLNG